MTTYAALYMLPYTQTNEVAMDTDKTPMPPRTYTVDEVAVMLRISRATAYRAVRSGAIPILRIGGTLRVPRRALDRMLDDAAA